MYTRIPGALDRSGVYFNDTPAEEIAGDIACMNRIHRNKVNVNRFRWCAFGEPFAVTKDIDKIHTIAKLLPNVQFWIPTRAWRKTALRMKIERGIMLEDNVRIMASIDPSNTERELNTLGRWRTMFFGDNDRHPLSVSAFKCPKTFQKGGPVTCKNCEGGCFNPTTRHIHLKKH